ncbi:MAG: FGGY family carbohydrate kinase, partial [Jatrophihabitantaceae bacterium]
MQPALRPARRPASVIAAIDQGTTSTRCLLFDHDARVVAVEQVEHRQHLPRPGWVEHDAAEIWANTRAVMAGAVARAELGAGDVVAIGITNQRETAVVWDRASGRPVGPAIVWQDTRTQSICDELAGLGGGTERYRERVGLPLATYFAGPKVRWMLDNLDGARARAEAGDLAFGTIDSWLLWNLSGGVDGGVHVTDPTNASRTMLMDLDTLQWVPQIAGEMGIPLSMLPQIRSSSEVYAEVRERGPLAGVPIAGILGDQQAATFGQACLRPGEAKNTYGTGNFLLLNTGPTKVLSENGLLTTVCYALAGEEPVYALEGSIAVTGSLVQWLRDNL